MLNKIPEEVEAHVNGRKYKRQLEIYLTRKKRREDRLAKSKTGRTAQKDPAPDDFKEPEFFDKKHRAIVSDSEDEVENQSEDGEGEDDEVASEIGDTDNLEIFSDKEEEENEEDKEEVDEEGETTTAQKTKTQLPPKRKEMEKKNTNSKTQEFPSSSSEGKKSPAKQQQQKQQHPKRNKFNQKK